MDWKMTGLAASVGVVALVLAGCAESGAQATNHHMIGHPAREQCDRTSGIADESLYLKENDAAMTRMMQDMDVKPTGDVDRDFVAMMVPHHQGAIDMAQAVLKYGRNEQIRRLAQEIIVTQQEEIAAMRMAVGEPLPAPAAAPTNPK
jgi:uncharacterized protein (DUF305 family)